MINLLHGPDMCYWLWLYSFMLHPLKVDHDAVDALVAANARKS